MAPPRTARQLASRRIFSISPDDTVADAAEALHRYRVNTLLLVSEAGVVGVLTRREIDDALHHGLGAVPASAISAGPPPAVAPQAPLAAIVPLTRQSRLVVVGEHAAPLGVITRTALHRALLPEVEPVNLWAAVAARLGTLASTLADLGALAEARETPALMIGGCVRDLLRERTPNDVDVVVVGDAGGLALAAAEALGGRATVNPEFGTAHWHTPGGVELDLASARTEHYTAPGALPTVVTPGELRQDLARRDFTINTMAISLSPDDRGELVDPYGGRADLSAGILRVVHGLSFLDDPTRIFRAARFAARLDLVRDPGTAALMTAALSAGVVLTRQRIGAELDRILAEPTAIPAVVRLQDWGVLGFIHPALAEDAGLILRMQAGRAAWEALSDTGAVGEHPAEVLWLTIAAGLEASARADLGELVVGVRGRQARWLRGAERVEEVLAVLSQTARRSAQAGAVAKLSPEELVLCAVQAPEPVGWWLRTGRHIPLPVDGRLLIARGARPGPGMGAAIAAAREVAWDGGDRDRQLAAAMRVLRG